MSNCPAKNPKKQEEIQQNKWKLSFCIWSVCHITIIWEKVTFNLSVLSYFWEQHWGFDHWWSLILNRIIRAIWNLIFQHLMTVNVIKCTLCFWLLQISRKFLPGYDSCFQTYLVQEIQKYDLNWNLTSPF